MSYRILTTAIIALFPLAFVASAQDIKDHDPLFTSDAALTVEIEGPFAMLAKDRPEDEEAPATFRFAAEDGAQVEFDIAVRTRGRWRHNKEICPFPPLRLNFKKSETDDTLFDKQDKLKLVTHCRNKAKRNVQAIISEYLAYRIFNVLTERSFRARLLKIKYVYTDSKKDMETYGFVIEHKDRLSKRIDAEPQPVERTTVEAMRPDDLNLASVFQYFLGNTDFSPIATAPDEDCCHNQALFTSEDPLQYTIPYDFDQTGLANAPYASPNPRFKLRSVRDRLYRGRCVNNDRLPATLDLFRERRGEIEALVNSQQELAKSTRRYLLAYIDDFYGVIDNPKKLDKQIIGKCI